MKKDFESQLRKQMEGYEVAPPDDLWQRIEGNLPTDPQLLSHQENGRKSRVAALRPWLAAAAALLLVVGGAGLLFHQHKEKTTARVEITANPGGVPKQTAAETTQPTMVAANENLPIANKPNSFARVPIINKVHENNPVLADNHPTEGQKEMSEVINGDERQVIPEGETTDNPPSADRPDVHTITVKTERQGQDKVLQPQSTIVAGIRNDDSRLMAAVHFDGTLRGASGGVSPVYMSDEMKSNFAAIEDYSNSGTRFMDKATLTGFEERKKYLPSAKFGLSVSYRLTDRWAVQTGVNYMLQRTLLTQKMKNDFLETQYNYEYIGIPVGVTYKVRDIGSWLTLYATAGAEADFNFKAKAYVDDVERAIRKDRPLFAVTTAAGMQLNLPLRFGFFVEPGVIYYFDNGSAVDTRMKDQPLNGSLLMGFRYAIK